MKIFLRFALAIITAFNPSSAFDKCESNINFDWQSFAYSKSLEWNGYLVAFTPFKNTQNIPIIDFEKMMRCNAIKFKYLEQEQKIILKVGCSNLCQQTCDNYCLSLKEQKNNSSADYTWKVTHYAHLTYLVIKYSSNSEKIIDSGLIIFVDTYDTWLRNELKFEKVKI